MPNSGLKDGETTKDSGALEKQASLGQASLEIVQLARLGIEHTAKRDIGVIPIIAIGWNICNSWAAVAATMAFSIYSGGPVTLIYGIIVVVVLSGSSAATMAELASVYPTAGGQYHWASIIAPKEWSSSLGYWTGASNLFGWLATAAGFAITIPQFTCGLVSFWNPNYVAERWHIFLIFQLVNLIFMSYNIWVMKRTAWIHDVGFVISVVGFFIILITCLVKSSPKQDSSFVWTTFINSSGWSSDGIVFLTGLINPNFIFSGLDGAIHLAEECTNAASTVPMALMSTIGVGFATSLAFAVAMTYSYYDFDAILGSAVPALEIWRQATSSNGLATFFVLILTVCGCFAVTGALQTASRLTWSFARDDALVFSSRLQRLHPTLAVPVWALLANSAVVAVIGFVYLGSTTAFNAMVASGLILQQASYAVPAALLLYRRRSAEFLPASRAFRLPSPLGWSVNVLSVVLAIISTVFYMFPAQLPATPGNMNYAIVVIGVMFLFALGNWFGYASKRYNGPRMD